MKELWGFILAWWPQILPAFPLIYIAWERYAKFSDWRFGRKKDKIELLFKLFEGNVESKSPFLVEQVVLLTAGELISKPAFVFIKELPNPSVQLYRYASGKCFIEFGKRGPRFKGKWVQPWRRSIFTRGFLLLYAIFAYAVYFFVFAYSNLPLPPIPIGLRCICALYFLLLTYYGLWRYQQMCDAIKFMDDIPSTK
jgi:hypothetical protein